MATMKAMMQLSKEAAKSGGIELAKEVPAPIASLVALGGFAAWWILSSGGPKAKGPLMTKWQRRVASQQANSTSDRSHDENTPNESFGNLDSRFEAYDEDDYVLVDGPEESEKLRIEELDASTEDLIQTTKKIVSKSQDARRQRAGNSAEDNKKEEFFNAIMQGDIQFVKAAFDQDTPLWPDLNTESCDEYGNTLLILATQVAVHP